MTATPDPTACAPANARDAAHPTHPAMPVVGLLALGMAGFLALLTETIPAGMLDQISAGLNISRTLAGQFVTLYAMGSLVAAVPLTTATQTWRRRPLLLSALAAILFFNLLTALSTHYLASLAARFLAGTAGGLVWGMLAGYARRLVPPERGGRAIALAGLGVPLALCLGVPIGALLSEHLGWRTTFGAIAVVTLAAMALIAAMVPDVAGQAAGQRLPIGQVLLTPGVPSVLVVLACWMAAHSLLYTYILPLVEPAGLASQASTVLLTFGLSSLAGIWAAGAGVDRRLRLLTMVSLTCFALAALALELAAAVPGVVLAAVAAWGMAFGGAGTLLQTASARAAGAGADVAQSLLTTVWNSAIAAGGIAGGLLLEHVGTGALGWAALFLATIALAVVANRTSGGFR